MATRFVVGLMAAITTVAALSSGSSHPNLPQPSVDPDRGGAEIPAIAPLVEGEGLQGTDVDLIGT